MGWDRPGPPPSAGLMSSRPRVLRARESSLEPALLPKWAPGAGSGGASPALPGHLPFATRAAEPYQVQALGSVVLLAMGLLVTCTLRLTFRLRTFLPDDVAGAVSPHLRRDPSCEAERLHHERTDTRRQQRFQQGREEAVMLPADTSVRPGQRMKPTVPALRTQPELTARTTARPVFGRVGRCPWCLCTGLESFPPGQRCLRGQSGHC